MQLERAANGYVTRGEFSTEEMWRAYLKKAAARRRDYRPLDVVAEETVGRAGSSPAVTQSIADD